MFDEDHLIALLQQHKRVGDPPPLTEAEVVRAEELLGFTLPPLLRRLYREVSHGGFGHWVAPLLPPSSDSAFADQEAIISLYQPEDPQPSFPSKEQPALAEEIHQLVLPFDDEAVRIWPKQVLYICDHGCNIYSVLDCSRPSCPVLLNDNNIGSHTFAVLAESLRGWLEGPLLNSDPPPFNWESARKVSFL